MEVLGIGCGAGRAAEPPPRSVQGHASEVCPSDAHGGEHIFQFSARQPSQRLCMGHGSVHSCVSRTVSALRAQERTCPLRHRLFLDGEVRFVSSGIRGPFFFAAYEASLLFWSRSSFHSVRAAAGRRLIHGIRMTKGECRGAGPGGDQALWQDFAARRSCPFALGFRLPAATPIRPRGPQFGPRADVFSLRAWLASEFSYNCH